MFAAPAKTPKPAAETRSVWIPTVVSTAAVPSLRATLAFAATSTICNVAPTMLDAASAETNRATLYDAGRRESRLTRRLRDVLHALLAKLQFGKVLMASIVASAPFVGLFVTVWGIYHALVSISAAGNITIDKISGPVGEALIMTAAGLAVAIPAVLAYNVFGKMVAACEADLEGFAHDLRELLDHE